MEQSTIVRRAFEEYQRFNYSKALDLYEQAGRKLGEKHFQANILLCRKKIATLIEERRTRFLAEICIDGEVNDRLELSDQPVWIDFAVEESDYVKLFIDVKYERIPEAEKKKALILIEYLGANGKVLTLPYKGLAKSDAVGWYVYLMPRAANEAAIILQPCAGTTRIRVGFRSYYKMGNQRVSIGRRIALRWHDNQPGGADAKPSHGPSPTLPCLPFEMPAKEIGRRLKVASILDPFSHACFEPECDLLSITPDRWREQLMDQKIDMVLVESAWHGNSDSWLYRVASYEKPPGNELGDVIGWAKKFNIPTIFWNKEDPPNFDRFIDRATEFDFIFTTDENCIERYRKRVGSSTRVNALPFAAQPSIHNPLLEQPRMSATSFAGTYYADDFEPRRRAMDVLLRAGARYGLDIFDRMHDIAGADKKRFEFPTDLRQHIRGSLAYDAMLKAYRHYRVGLNVNSVSDSPTMFSRRVFELLACGTPVVSTRSSGIDKIFKGLVPTVESEAEASKCLESLMTDASSWLRASVRGIRTVFTQHTYAHRLNDIARVVGLDGYKVAATSVLMVVHPGGDATRFASMVAKQVERPQEVVVVGAAHADPAVRRHLAALKGASIKATALPAANIASYVRQRHLQAVVAVCDSHHHYGPAYLLDARISLEGTPEFEASTMQPGEDVEGFLSNSEFSEVSRIGVPTTKAYAGTVAVKAGSPLLASVVTWPSCGDVDSAGRQLRTRARFEFIPNLVASGIADPTIIHLS